MGGGEILRFVGNKPKETEYLDPNALAVHDALPFIIWLTVGFIILSAIILILRTMGIKSFRLHGINNAISNIEKLRERDKAIIKINKALQTLTNIVQGSIFRLDKNTKNYYAYNLKRAGIKVPGGYRYLEAEEFNAIIICAGAVLISLSLAIFLILNPIFGVVCMVASLTAVSVLPMVIIRSIVTKRNKEIRENFMDLYLMLHYNLLLGGDTPIEKIMGSYAKATDSEEMKRFVENCIGHIDIHGEYNATMHIARDYKEIPEVNKLMRLIRQLHEGGDVKQELLGFRDELIKDRKYHLERKMNKLVSKARFSFNLLMIILFQAILSAMAIYIPDLQGIGSFF